MSVSIPRPLVTSVRVKPIGGHDHVFVWNRGANAGHLVVNEGDGKRIAERLLPTATSEQSAHDCNEYTWRAIE